LYFRSLKRIKVLALLTKYLLQYRRLSIPHVGTFELVQHSPEFNVVDQLIRPPSFRLDWNQNDLLTDHQLCYLADSIRSDKEKVREELESFGKKLRTEVRKESFNWRGIGTLTGENDAIAVDEGFLKMDGLTVVPAHKLIRENVEHSVLVGDQQMTSQQVADTLTKGSKKRSYKLMIGWILFFLALAAIVFILYRNGFNPLASGLKLKTTSSIFY
jgi:hypothetical protein